MEILLAVHQQILFVYCMRILWRKMANKHVEAS